MLRVRFTPMSHPILTDAQTRMKKSVDHTLHEFSTLHTGKASPAMVEGILVEAYGGTQQLKACRPEHRVTNLRLQTLAPQKRTTHLAMPYDDVVLRETLKALAS